MHLKPEARAVVCHESAQHTPSDGPHAFPYTVNAQAEFELAYDQLIVATGCQTATFGIPGVQEVCTDIS